MSPFTTLILLGRPASGKSEFIDALRRIPDAERLARYHVGRLIVLDDFVWLWAKFQEDDLWEAAGHARRYSKRAEHAYVLTEGNLLNFLLAKFNAEFLRTSRGAADTVLIEFSRGAGDGGYAHALGRLADAMLREAAILFVQASYAESCRRNEARYQEKLRHSILAHRVPEEDQVRFAKEIDWDRITHGAPQGHLPIREFEVPFVTMDNEIELKEPAAFRERCRAALDRLMELWHSRHETRSVRYA
ncbi:MAG: hypothetical protein HY543_01140 [Deltaproteobacteria bacterium]|nr:hypothetical protein [Deltaproteobacteria bacterium]